MAPKYIQRLGFVSIPEWNNAFKFTFVRVTYDRLVSWFCWNTVGTPVLGARAAGAYNKYFDKKNVDEIYGTLGKEGNINCPPLPGGLHEESSVVAAFRRWVEDGCVSHLSNPDRHWNGKGSEPARRQFNHFLPSSVEKLDEWVLDRDGNEYLDFIGRFENYEEDLQYVRNKLKPVLPKNLLRPVNGSQPMIKGRRNFSGVNSNNPIPHKGKSQRMADYTKYYDETSRKIVDEIFAKEIARFGFVFGSDKYNVSPTLRKP